MKYSHNLIQQLIHRGFEFSSSYSDKEISYEVYKRNHLEVTIDHTNKQIGFDIVGFEDTSVKVETFDELNRIITAIETILPTT